MSLTTYSNSSPLDAVDTTFKMDAGAWAFVSKMLSRPFEFHELKTRKQWAPGGDIYLLYVDSRVYQERLDEVVGAQNWEVSQKDVSIIDTMKVDVTPADAPKNPKNQKPLNPVYEYREVKYGGIQTSLTVFGVSKSDVGNPSMAEQIKGAYSDGLKRAGVLWGMGRYLYEIKNNKAASPNENNMPDFAQPYDAPDFDTSIRASQVSIGNLIKEGNLPLERIPEIIAKVRELVSQYDADAPLVYKRFVSLKLAELDKTVKGMVTA